MFTETIKSKCLDEMHYLYIISMAGDIHWKVLLKTDVPNFWKYKEI